MNKGHDSNRHAAWEYRIREGPGQKVEDNKEGKTRDKQWRPEGGGKIQADGRSATRIFGGGEAGKTERSGAASNGEEWGDGRS